MSRLRLHAVFVIAAMVVACLCASGCLPFHAGALPDVPKKDAFGEAHYKTIQGTRVHYIDVGEGPPVVLRARVRFVAHAWKGVIGALRKDHRVIALDLKGFGWTDRPEGDYSPPAQAKLVFGLLDALGVDHSSIVAHSWGSSVALQMALDAPKRVDRIVLYDAWVYEEQLPTLFIWARADGIGEALFSMFYDQRTDDKIALAFYDRKNVTEEVVEGVEQNLERPGATAAALAAVRGQRYAEVSKKYATIDKPVLLLWGREDKITLLEYGERLSKDLPRAKLIVYPQCGHFPMVEAKAPSTRETVEFLAPLSANPLPGPVPPTPSPAPAPSPASTFAPPPTPPVTPPAAPFEPVTPGSNTPSEGQPR